MELLKQRILQDGAVIPAVSLKWIVLSTIKWTRC